MSRATVSVLTPTYNRRMYIPMLIQCYKNQTYPKELMEWVVVDDPTDTIKFVKLFVLKGKIEARSVSVSKDADFSDIEKNTNGQRFIFASIAFSTLCIKLSHNITSSSISKI